MDLLSPKKLRNRYLCENHFQNKCFTNPNDKSRLNYGALTKKSRQAARAYVERYPSTYVFIIN